MGSFRTVVDYRNGHPSRTSLLRTYGALLRTLDISVRYLAASAVGRGGFAYADELLRGWGQDILRDGDYALFTTGAEAFDGHKAYVVMSNHTSMLDVPVLVAAVPTPIRMVAKQDLMKVPIWGRAMEASGFIPISRNDRSKAVSQLETAKERLRQGISVWISPEGTRSRDGKLGELKKGGFHLALDLGIPILPAWIAGTHEAMGATSFEVRTNLAIAVHFGQPIATEGLERGEIPGLMGEVREALLGLSKRVVVG